MMKAWVGCVMGGAAGLAVTLTACDSRATRGRAIDHDAYVWQRRWTPDLVRVMAESGSRVQRWRVLGAEMDVQTRLSEVSVDHSVLANMRKPVVLVVRINGQIPAWNPEQVNLQTAALVRRWRRLGVPVVGLEIDHDCATSRLPTYTRFLEVMRHAGSEGLPLSITGLPAWLESPHLPWLLAQVDEVVLQVHAVKSPAQGLFDRGQAYGWIKRLAARSRLPMRVALPTYGSRVSWDASGRVTGVESERAQGGPSAFSKELFVRPTEVAGLVADLHRRSPASFTGVTWFRVPTDADERAWSPGTWRAVIDGRDLTPQAHARVVPGEAAGLFDVYLINGGEIDTVMAHAVRITTEPGLAAADALAPYTMRKDSRGVRFVAENPPLLRAGQKRLVGWLRCPDCRVQVDAQF